MKNTKLCVSLSKLIACLLLLVMVPISALASYQSQAMSSAKMFSKMQTGDANYMITVPRGSSVTVKDEYGEWLKITYKNNTGYVKSKYFSKKNGSAGYTTRSVKLYQNSTSGSKVLDTLSANYPLTLYGDVGRYTYVKTKDGSKTGYVLTSYISATSKDPFEVSSSRKKTFSKDGSTTRISSAWKSTQSYMSSSMSDRKKLEYMIYFAQSKLGCDYTRSSANNTYTFNNASFVKACYKVLGYSLSSSAKDIGHSGKYAYVSRSSLKRGDIVCFECDTTDSEIVDHVGVYLGSGYFIHASTSADCVIVSKMSSGYYYNAFCWGRRVIG